jgi:lysophospholipase L1-like esterase
MRVLVFGASTVQGFWDSKGGWADRLKRYYYGLQIADHSAYPPRIFNLGILADSTKEILRRFDVEAEARVGDNGSAFIIQVGTNNAVEQNGKMHSTPEEYADGLEQLVKKCYKHSKKILIVGLPAVIESKTNPVPWVDFYYKNHNIKKIEEAAQSVAKKNKLDFVAIHEIFTEQMSQGRELMAWDGLHPSDEGHKLIFELVRNWINS